MKLYVIRHGEVETSPDLKAGQEIDPNPSLSETGRSQILEACPRLKELDINAIYSSMAKRANQTVGIVYKQLNLGYEYLPQINPVEIPSKEELKTWLEEMAKSQLPWYVYWLQATWGFEYYSMFSARIMRAINQMRNTHGQSDKILWVCHEETVFVLRNITQGISIEKACEIAVPHGYISEFRI